MPEPRYHTESHAQDIALADCLCPQQGESHRKPSRCRHPRCRPRWTARAEYLKSRPVKDPALRRQWSRRHDCCQVCGIHKRNARWQALTRGLQTHHIIKPGRSDEPCNLMRLCARCHRIVEGERVPDAMGGHYPQLTLAHVLYCKREHDPGEYDRDRLTVLWRQRERVNGFDPLPRPRPLPAIFAQERLRWSRTSLPW